MQKNQIPRHAEVRAIEFGKFAEVEADRHRRLRKQVQLMTCSLKDNSIAALLNYPTLTQVVANDNAFENVDNLKPLVSLK